MTTAKRSVIGILTEFSIPLLSGVGIALLAANVFPDWYAQAIHWMPFGEVDVLGHALTLHWFVNDVFMVFFFGIAAKEITESCLPGGSLNPPRKAVNPLLATLGGVVGPVLVFFGGLWLCFETGIYTPADDHSLLMRGWGIPTATDIALAWLVARAVFGKGHPAIDFLLLLAVADDAVGLVIIAVFYGSPAHPAEPLMLSFVGLALVVGYVLRRLGVSSWIPYVALAGPLSWLGLVTAHLHPALALVVVIPFLPGPRRDTGMFTGRDEVDVMGDELADDLHIAHSPLHRFEHQTKPFVDFGLFFFAFTNAGVALAGLGTMTWLILGGLVVGKTVGVTAFGLLGRALGFPLPARMGVAELAMSGLIASLGLTVALFVATAAFTDPALQGEAKMGALLSGLVGLLAVPIARLCGVGTRPKAAAESDAKGDESERGSPPGSSS